MLRIFLMKMMTGRKTEKFIMPEGTFFTANGVWISSVTKTTRTASIRSQQLYWHAATMTAMAGKT